MADGHARATKKPTIVQLHSTPGVGNGIGVFYQAKRGHSPLIVIGGDAGIKYMLSRHPRGQIRILSFGSKASGFKAQNCRN